MLHDHAQTGSNAAASSDWQNVHRSLIESAVRSGRSGFLQLEGNKTVEGYLVFYAVESSIVAVV